MAQTTTIPVTITPEAATRVAELGMQRELEQMLEHAKQTVPGLHAITVILESRYELGDEPSITIEAARDAPRLEYDPTDMEWIGWLVDTFPPEVCEHFVMMPVFRTAHDR